MVNLNSYERTPAAYKVLTMLGHCFNTVGSVWLARHATSGNLVAVKKYDVDKCSNEVLSILQHESQAMRQLRHPSLMPCLSAFVAGTELWMVEPLCGYGSTKDLLAAHFTDGLPERAIAIVLRDVLRALDYLHSQGYIHRSVRASHVLISDSGATLLAGLRSSVCSFRGGRRLRRVHQFPELSADGLNWLSPEVLAQDLRGYTFSSDIYSLGITACELANGREPYAQKPAAMLYEKLAGVAEPGLLDASTVDAGFADREAENGGGEGDEECGLSASFLRLMRAAPTRRFSDAFHQFVRLCVDREPLRRPSAQRLQHHPFIVRQCRRAPPLTHLLRPGVPINEATLLEGEQIMRDRLVPEMSSLHASENAWQF